MADSVRHVGGCLCGAVRFEATSPARNPHTCSCTMCRRHSGALTPAWVEFPREAVRWIGPGGAPAAYHSSEVSSRAFCPRCGSTQGAIDDAAVVALLLGVFDDPGRDDFAPASQSLQEGLPDWWQATTGRG